MNSIKVSEKVTGSWRAGVCSGRAGPQRSGLCWSGFDTPQTPEEPLPAASHKPRDGIVLVDLAGEELGDSSGAGKARLQA